MQSDENLYLKQEILGASPIRLRWMLIRRSVELCSLVENLWSDGKEVEADGWLLRVREILGELLSGVQDESNPLSKSVSDFYVYLLKLLTETQQTRSLSSLGKLKMLLAIEQETWHQVKLKNEGHLPVAAASQEERLDAPHAKMPFVAQPKSNTGSAASGLNLEV